MMMTILNCARNNQQRDVSWPLVALLAVCLIATIILAIKQGPGWLVVSFIVALPLALSLIGKPYGQGGSG